MSNYLKGNTWSTIYTQILGVGATGDHAGLTSSLKEVWTDAGDNSKNLAPFKLSTSAIQMTTTSKLEFFDTGIYIHSSGDGIMNLVADGEIDLATAALDVNATSTCEIDNTNTTNGVKLGVNTSGGKVFLGHTTSETTVNDNLTVTGTTTLNSAATLADGIKLQFVDGNEYISGDSTDLTIGSSGDINLSASSNVNVPANKKITFGHDDESIVGDGSNLSVASSGALNLTGAAASTWKTTAGAIQIDAQAAPLDLNGHSGVNIIGNAAEIDLTTSGAIDLNSAAFTLDGTTISIDGDDDSNFTVTGSGKTLLLQSTGGGAAQQTQLKTAGTGASAMEIFSTAGGIDITSVGGAGKDIDITATGSINISSTENAADGIVLNSTAGGIDIIAAGTSGEDIDITATGSSVNITATEDHSEAIKISTNGGTSEGIKIHADQGTGDKSVYLLSDVGSVTIDAGNTSADKGVLINTNTNGGKVYIGHATSETTVQDNLTVSGDLTVSGSASYGTLGISHPTATVFTLDNQEHSDADGARDITLKFTGEKQSGASVDDMAQIIVAHDGSASDEKGFIDFRTNSGSEGTSPTSALKLSADNTATFSGSIVSAQLNADNLRLDGNVLSSTDTDGNITLTPNGTGSVVIDGCTINVDSDSVIDAGPGTGTDNTIFGHDAGDAIQSGSSYNSIFGADAGTSLTTGAENVAIGASSLGSVTDQNQNTAVGRHAMGVATCTAGTAIGRSALYNATGGSNTAVGAQAGFSTTSGASNTFVGNSAGSGNTTAGYSTAMGNNALAVANRTSDTNAHNTAIGYNSGLVTSTGQFNTYLGSQAGETVSTGTHNICLGFHADVSANTVTHEIVIGVGESDSSAFTGAGTETIKIGRASDFITCDFGENATWSHSSDERIKKDIKDNELGLNFINELKTVTYKKKAPSEYPKEFEGYNADETERKNPEKNYYGFVAQEVKKAMEAVGNKDFPVWSEQKDGMQTLSESQLITPLVKAIQELTARIEKLEGK